MSRPSIFISYAHEDEYWKDRLVRHLTVLEDELAVWDDRRIDACRQRPANARASS